MATPDTDFDAQDTAEAFDETHSTDEDGAPDETRSFAPDLFDDVYDATKAEGDEDIDEDDEALDAADYDPDDLDVEALEEDDADDADLMLDDEEDDLDDEDDEDLDDGLLAASPDDAELEYTDDLDDAGQTGNRQARRFESAHELSAEQVADLGYSAPDEDDRPEDIRGSGACADDVEDESHPRQEDLLDEGIEESFPASDPVSVKRIT